MQLVEQSSTNPQFLGLNLVAAATKKTRAKTFRVVQLVESSSTNAEFGGLKLASSQKKTKF